MRTGESQVFVARQAILDARQRIVGYELYFRDDADAQAAHFDDPDLASARVLANTLIEIGSRWVLGGKRAFLNAGAGIVRSEMVELLEPRSSVLALGAVDPVALRPLAPRLKELRARGYGVAVALSAPDPAWDVVLPAISHFEIDAGHAPGFAALPEVQRLRRYGARLVATRVEQRAQFAAARDAGFDLFQGHFFAHPETLSARVVVPAYGIVLQALNLTQREADLHDIESVLKQDPALSFKLLRYINSAAFGLTREVASLADAIRLLGYRQVSRWLALVLVTARIDDGTALALAQTAATRGRLLELLGSGNPDTSVRDALFIAGLFSMLPTMLDQPIERIVGPLHLPPTLKQALVEDTGPLAPYLRLALACERTERPALLREHAEALQIAPAELNRAHVEGLAFAESITA